MIAGQFLDVSAQARGHADVDTAMTVLRYKSAKYSIERPLHLGAALAGAPATTLAELTAFGLPLGEAFQLRDDLLGVFGDPDTTGKPAGDDLVEGKRTVLVALALDSAPAADAALLDRALGTPLSPDDVERLRGVIDASGAHAQVEAVIDQLSDVALAALDRASIDERRPRGAARASPTAVTQRVGSVHRLTRVVSRATVTSSRPGPSTAAAASVEGRTSRRSVARIAAGSCSKARPARPRGPACPSRPTAGPWLGEVAEAVVEGVEVLPVVVGEGQRLADGGQELVAGLVVPAVDVAERQPACSTACAHVVGVEGRVPAIDARVVVAGQDRRPVRSSMLPPQRSARRTRSGPRPVELTAVTGDDPPGAAVRRARA